MGTKKPMEKNRKRRSRVWPLLRAAETLCLTMAAIQWQSLETNYKEYSSLANVVNLVNVARLASVLAVQTAQHRDPRSMLCIAVDAAPKRRVASRCHFLPGGSVGLACHAPLSAGFPNGF